MNMERKYGIDPNPELHACMVEALGCAGFLERAMSLIKIIPCSSSSSSLAFLPIWLSILNACKKWENPKLGRLAFNHVMLLDKACATAFVLMAKIYASAGMQQHLKEIEEMRLKNCVGVEKDLFVDSYAMHSRNGNKCVKVNYVSCEKSQDTKSDTMCFGFHKHDCSFLAFSYHVNIISVFVISCILFIDYFFRFHLCFIPLISLYVGPVKLFTIITCNVDIRFLSIFVLPNKNFFTSYNTLLLKCDVMLHLSTFRMNAFLFHKIECAL